MNKSIIGVIAIVIIVAAAGLFFLRGQNSSAPAATTETQTDTSTNDTSTTQQVPVDADSEVDEMVVDGDEHGDEMMEENVDEAREIVVDGSEFSFSPATLTVTEGEKIKLTFNNVGTFPHNFIVDELNVATKTIGAGLSDTVEFTAKESGTFEFYCSVGTHRAQGMEGTFVIN